MIFLVTIAFNTFSKSIFSFITSPDGCSLFLIDFEYEVRLYFDLCPAAYSVLFFDAFEWDILSYMSFTYFLAESRSILYSVPLANSGVAVAFAFIKLWDTFYSLFLPFVVFWDFLSIEPTFLCLPRVELWLSSYDSILLLYIILDFENELLVSSALVDGLTKTLLEFVSSYFWLVVSSIREAVSSGTEFPDSTFIKSVWLPWFVTVD